MAFRIGGPGASCETRAGRRPRAKSRPRTAPTTSSFSLPGTGAFGRLFCVQAGLIHQEGFVIGAEVCTDGRLKIFSVLVLENEIHRLYLERPLASIGLIADAPAQC